MTQELLTQAKSGNQNAICAIIEAFDPTMERFAHKLCANNEDADESLQHARLVIAKKLNSFKEMSKLTTWLYAVIKNECYRLQKKMFGFSFHEAPASELLERPRPDQAYEKKELLLRLSQSLAEMDHGDLELILQKDVQGRSLQEISEELGLTIEAIKSRLHRSRQRLKTRLAERNISVATIAEL